MKMMTRTLPILLLTALTAAPALAERGGGPRPTRKQDNWLQAGVKKVLANRGYGKLRIGKSRPKIQLGKMNKPLKPAKRQTAGGVVVDPASKKVLLVRIRKAAKGGRSGWTWPKGRVDSGERAHGAAMRETYEESGVQALPVAKIAQLKSGDALRHYYLMKKVRDEGRFDPKETLEVRWVSLRRASKMLERSRDQKVLGAARATIKALQKAATLP